MLTGEEAPRLVLDVGHAGWITAVAFSPDGRLLATSGEDGTVIVWELATGSMLHRLPTGRDGASELHFSPFDPSTLVVVDFARSYRLAFWDLASGRWLGTIPNAGPPIRFLTADEVIAANEHGFGVLDTVSGRVLRGIRLVADWAACPPALSADGSLGAMVVWIDRTPYGPQELRVWEVPSGEPLVRSPLPRRLVGVGINAWTGEPEEWDDEPGDVWQVMFSPAGESLALIASQSVWLADPRTAEVERVLAAGCDLITRSAFFSPDGECLAMTADAIEEDRAVLLYRVRDGSPSGILRGGRWMSARAFSPDGRLIAVAEAPGLLGLHEVPTLAPAGRLRGMEYAWGRAAWSPDGRQIACALTDGSVRLWSAVTGEQTATLRGHTEPVDDLRFLASGDVEARSALGETTVWERAATRLVRHLPGMLLDDPTCARDMHRALSPDGRLEAIFFRDAPGFWQTEIRRADTAEVLVRLSDDPGSESPPVTSPFPECFAFSPSGQLLAAGDWDNGVWVTDVKTGELRHWLYTPSPVGAVAFSPDGRWLAAGMKHDGFIALWDLPEVPERVGAFHEKCDGDVTLEEHGAGVRGLCFSPDGRFMASASEDATLKVWDTATWKVLVTTLILPDGANAPSDQWIAYTPDGFYHGSPGAERWIRWQVDGRLLPGEEYAAAFRQPERVAAALAE